MVTVIGHGSTGPTVHSALRGNPPIDDYVADGLFLVIYIGGKAPSRCSNVEGFPTNLARGIGSFGTSREFGITFHPISRSSPARITPGISLAGEYELKVMEMAISCRP